MKKIIRFSVLSTLVVVCLVLFQNFTGTNTTGTVRGFDWIDFSYPLSGIHEEDQDLLNRIQQKTKMNIVRSLESLNSDFCLNKECAVGISAGQGSAGFDVCPGANDSTHCEQSSWQNIWKIVSQIKSAKNLPASIYFIDEPFYVPALGVPIETLTASESILQNRYILPDGKVYQYRHLIFSSYVCTLREAMAANGFSVPIFTVLAMGQLQVSNFVKEIQGHVPTQSKCQGRAGMVDWVGIDNYDWSNVNEIISTYNSVSFGSVAPLKWVLVPPALPNLSSMGILNDQKMKSQLCAYYHVASKYAEYIPAMMFFRFDSQFMKTGVYENQSYPNFVSALIEGPEGTSCLELPPVLKPEILKSGRGCSDNNCIWIVVKNIAPDFRIDLRDVNYKNKWIYNQDRLVISKQSDGNYLITLKITEKSALGSLKIGAGLNIWVVNPIEGTWTQPSLIK